MNNYSRKREPGMVRVEVHAMWIKDSIITDAENDGRVLLRYGDPDNMAMLWINKEDLACQLFRD